MTDERTRTAVDELAEAHLAASLELSPIQATYLGYDIGQDRYDDFSPAGLDEQIALSRDTLARADRITPSDQVDRVTLAALRERLGLEVEAHAAGADLLSLNGIATGLHDIRETHDMMPTETDDDWAAMGKRLHNVPTAVEGWLRAQQAAIAAGLRPARRQVEVLAGQCRSWSSVGGYFDSLAASAGTRPEAVARDLAEGIALAKHGFAEIASRILDEIGPQATPVDAVGRERYLLASRYFLGTTIDVDETYQWGLAEVARVDAEQRATADQIISGASVREVTDALDADPRYQLHGTDELRAWMQRHTDQAVAALLASGQFDLDERLRRIECRIADTDDGGIYYTAPSDDFTRPGRMWWSVPEGEDTFGVWRELTTVYHEGVPGHHLQHAIALANSDLNGWRKNGLWVSGHGEGWALYAERLMSELGFHDDPATRLGMLDAQALRAVRVVIDIGLHCGLPAPAEIGGGEWTFDKAWQYFNSHCSLSEGQARFELLRYFGWPGQAPSYKLGERHWLGLRDQVRRLQGDRFSLPEFHQRALEVGTLGLDVLTEALLTEFTPRP